MIKYPINSLDNFNALDFEKLNIIQASLIHKVYFLKLKTTLNNIYLTLTNNFGSILLVKSGGFVKLINSKRNTGYVLELLLQDFLKYIRKIKLCYIVLTLDIMNLKKRKIILNFLNKNSIKVVYVKLITSKAFNGVRCKKKRRV